MIFLAAEQAEIQKTIDELRTEVDKRDAEIKHLQKNLKEAETILVLLLKKFKIHNFYTCTMYID